MPEKDMIAPEAEAYDILFKKQIDRDAKKRLESQWTRRGFYDIASSYLPNNNKRVIELGCGDGFFTNFIGKRPYIGIDFCKVLIEHGKKLYPNMNLMVGDLRSKEIQDMFDKNSVYVCLEVLEHIPDELSVVEKIPVGCDFIFSVPSADNDYHVRYFQSYEEIRNRYKSLLKFIKQDEHKTRYGNCIRVSKTVRI